MPYALREGLGFCQADGGIIFFDVRRGSYFGLPKAMENAFVTYAEQRDDRTPALADLVKLAILVESRTSTPISPSSLVDRPNHSALERPHPTSASRSFALPEVFATICSTKWQLKHRSLTDVLSNADAYRRARMKQPSFDGTCSREEQALDAADEFLRARLFVPVATSCLLDSLSLLTFLSKRGIPADVIFGVVRLPFAAHCWVQSGDWALNDTVGNTDTYTPIWKL